MSGCLLGEYLRRVQTDSLTHRPVEATGGYGQLGWYLPVGVEPIRRRRDDRGPELRPLEAALAKVP